MDQRRSAFSRRQSHEAFFPRKNWRQSQREYVKRVAIIGGGLAGLSCAYSLKLRAIDTTVFDAAFKPGGRDTAAVFLLTPHLSPHTSPLTRPPAFHSHVT